MGLTKKFKVFKVFLLSNCHTLSPNLLILYIFSLSVDHAKIFVSYFELLDDVKLGVFLLRVY
jgi:hypothetical protein